MCDFAQYGWIVQSAYRTAQLSLLLLFGELLQRRILSLMQKDKEHIQSKGKRLSRNELIGH